MHKYRIAVAIIALSMVFATLPIFTAHANYPTTTMYVDPATTNAVTNNDYTVYIMVSNVTDLYAWEFQLTYNTAILSLVSGSVVSGGLNTPTNEFVQNNTAGHLWWAVSTTWPTLTGISYSGHAVFEIVFHAIATGTTNLTLSGDILADHTGAAITHDTVSGSITAGTVDLVPTSIVVVDQGCSIYANDVYSNGITPYYVEVDVKVKNTGDTATGGFHVELDVYSLTYSVADGSGKLPVAAGLTAGEETTLTFMTVFHPTHTHYYKLTAIADCDSEVVESNEANNVLEYHPGDGIKVTVIGDINGDTTVNILDAVAIGLAWGATPSDGWWNIKADINHNGIVDVSDGTRIGLHWGQTW